MSKRPWPIILTLLILLMVGYAAFFSAQLLLHYYSFGSRALDLGNMNQAIWNTWQGRPFHQTNQPGATNRLSLHVEPMLLPISLLYYLYAGPETLFGLQSIIVALGAIPVFALARYKLHSDGLALIFALVYLMFPAIQGATLLDFHAVTLAPTFLLAAFYFLETRRPAWFALFAGLAVACKEDITLLVLMMGLYALLVNRQVRLGLITIALCLAWAYVAVFVIPPAFAGTENIHWNRYDHLGDSPAQIGLNFFVQPQLALTHLQAVNALEYLRLLLAPTAYTALFSPLTLLLMLPSLGINLFSSFPPMQRVNSLIYAAPLVPAVIISSIYGVYYLKRFALKRLNVLTFKRFNVMIGLLLLMATFIYHWHYGYLPGGGQFRGWEEVTDHHRRLSRLLAQLPPDAAVSAHDRLNPHVSGRETLYIFDRLEEADHIVLDVTEDSWPLHPVELRNRVNEFLRGEWGLVDAFDGYLLLAKSRSAEAGEKPVGAGLASAPTELPDEFYDFARVRVPNPATFQPDYPAQVVFDGKLKLLGYDLEDGAHEAHLPVITLYWQALEPLDEDYNLWPFFIDREGRLIEDTSQRPLVATLWYPTSRWQPGEIIATRTLPWDLGDVFTVVVGVMEERAEQGSRGASPFQGDRWEQGSRGGEEAENLVGWADTEQRLKITAAAESLPVYEGQTWARLGTFERVRPQTYAPVTPLANPPSQPRQVTFWNLLTLQGVDLPSQSLRPGESLPFTLYWQSAAPLTVDLKTFAHLLDDQGNMVAQLDWTPQDGLGYLPTTSWRPGQPVIDHQAIPLPPDLPPGQYRLVVGWYYPVTGQRLPITASDTGESGEMVRVGAVTVR